MLRADHFLRDQQVHDAAGLIADPAVSVVLPTFRRGDGGLLERAVRSVLDQTMDALELIVVDDGSTDSTAEVVRALQARDPRVRYVRHDLNSGLPALRVNEGLRLARAPYVAYQFDDDRWTADALETLLGAARDLAEPSVVYGQCIYREGEYEHLLGDQVTPYLLSLHNRFANNAVLHPRDFPERFGGYDQHIAMRRLCDWDLWLRWISRAPFVFVPQPVSLVDARQAGSIGATVPYDLALFRAFAGVDRTETLRLSRCGEQEVDAGLDPERFVEPLRASARRQIEEYYARRRGVEAEVRPADADDRAVSVVTHVFDTSVDITFLNFRETSAAPVQLVPYSELAAERQSKGGAVAFVRTFLPEIDAEMRKLSEADVATIYALDDDLPNFFEMDPTLWYLEPGNKHYQSMLDSIAMADVGFAYSPTIAATMSRWNPRVTLQSTNIPERWLPQAPRPPRDGPVRIAFAGTGARAEEFAVLWPAIQQIASRYRDGVEFYFWGFSPEGADQLPSRVETLPYVTGYQTYLRRLTAAGFDIMLAPLFERWRAKQAKCPVKLLEITAAGALGVYSDCLPYAPVEHAIDGFKAADTVDAWVAALSHALEISPADRGAMVGAALAKVRRDYTTEALTPRFQAGLAAADFHRATRKGRGLDGRPAVALLAGAAATASERDTLIRTATLLARYGVRPVLFAEGRWRNDIPGVEHVPLTAAQLVEPSAIAEALARRECILLHAVGAHSAGEKAARLAGVPVAVAAGLEPPPAPEVDKVDADLAVCRSRGAAGRWVDQAATPSVAISDPLPEAAFSRLERLAPEGDLLRVAVPAPPGEGSSHLIALRALGEARKAPLGLDFPPGDAEAVETLKAEARRLGLLRRCRFDHARGDSDAILVTSPDPDPADVQTAMAAGLLVIGRTGGGAGEMLGEATGVVLDGADVGAISRALGRYAALGKDERSRRRHLAWTVVRREASEDAVARRLLSAYAGLAEKGEARRQAAMKALAESASPPVPSEGLRTLDDVHDRLAERVTAINGSLTQRAYAVEAELERVRLAGSAATAERLRRDMESLQARVGVELEAAEHRQGALLAEFDARMSADAAAADDRHAEVRSQLAEGLEVARDERAALAGRLEHVRRELADVSVRAAGAADADYVDAAVSSLVREKISRERNRTRLLQIASRWVSRRRDLTSMLRASWFADWLNDPQNARAEGERIQIERFWRAGETEVFDLPGATSGMTGLDLAAWLFLPPARPKPVLLFEILDASGAVLREGVCEADRMTGREAARMRFDGVADAAGPLRVRLTGLPGVEDVGLKLYEIRRVQPLTHRVRRRRLLHRTQGPQGG